MLGLSRRTLCFLLVSQGLWKHYIITVYVVFGLRFLSFKIIRDGKSAYRMYGTYHSTRGAVAREVSSER